MHSKLLKLRKDTEKIPELEQEIEILREAKSILDKSKLQFMKEKADFEEQQVYMQQRYENLQ